MCGVPDQAEPDLLRRFLAERGAPCPSCGYDLRGLAGDRCPECNQALRLQVGLVEPRLGAFIAGLVAISSGLGFCALLLVYVIFWIFRKSFSGPPREFFVVAVGAVVSAVTAWGWLRARGAIGRMPAGKRWLLVGVVSAVSLACPAIFIVTVR